MHELQIAFGTMFYPKDTAKLHAFIDELISSGTPFLWGHASPMAIVPADLETKLQATKNAFHTNWIPQRAALSHAATGWFLSHGGWNSVQDALGLKVPMYVHVQVQDLDEQRFDNQLGYFGHLLRISR
jgi:hypothetical protein